MSMTQASSRYFEKVAGQWDNLRSDYFTEAVRQAAIDKAYLRTEMTVADVGSGTGFIAAGLAPLVSRVHVLDGSPAMIEVARNNLSSFSNIEYHIADGQSLPLPEGSVDVAFANMYLHHCPDPQSALREMVRILKPGGRLVITDMDSHPYTWLKTEMADEWLGFEREQIRAWFKEIGLVNVVVDCTGQTCNAESQNPNLTSKEGKSANISVFVATGTRRQDVHEAVQKLYSKAAQGSGCGCSSPEPQDNGCGCSSPEAPKTRDNQKNSLASSSCCSSNAEATPSKNSFDIGYSSTERAEVPVEAEEISLGCGNPIAMASLRPGEVVVDIGSGGGMDSFLAASRVGESGKVVGVDMTPAMLERARATARKNGIKNVEFRQGHAEALPVADQSVDVILSNCVINLCEDKGQVFPGSLSYSQRWRAAGSERYCHQSSLFSQRAQQSC